MNFAQQPKPEKVQPEAQSLRQTIADISTAVLDARAMIRPNSAYQNQRDRLAMVHQMLAKIRESIPE